MRELTLFPIPFSYAMIMLMLFDIIKKNLFLFHLLFSTCIFIIVYISEQIVK